VSEATEVLQDQGARIRLVAMHRNARQPVRELNQIITVLGSGDGCDLILASSKVDSAHAAVIRLADTAYLCDLGAAAGTTLNGRRVRWARLADGDAPALGPFSFKVELEEAGSSAGAAPPVFSVREDRTIGVIRSIDPVLVIGSDPGCDVVLKDPTVAPRHALVVWTQIGPMVRDLLRQRSVRRNGRKVNSERLASGDSIGIGRFELIFETSEAPQEEMPSAGSPAPGHTSAEDTLTSEADCLAAGLPPGPQEFGRRQPTVDELAESLLAAQSVEAPSGGAGQDAAPGPIPPGQRVEASGELEAAGFDISSFAGQEPAAGEPAAPASARLLELEEREKGLKARVIAAQHALDERARKLWDGLSAEREKLKSFQTELQAKARELLEAAHQKHRELTARDHPAAAPAAARQDDWPPEGSAYEGPRPSEEAAVYQGLGLDYTEEEVPGVERVFGGEFEPEAASLQNAEQTARAVEEMLKAGAVSHSTDGALQVQAVELADLVRIERDEMEKAEARLETLRFEIERLHSLVARTRDRHQAQGSQLETRFQALRTSQAALRQEREELAARLRLLESREQALRGRVEEADRCKRDLDREARELAQLEQEHEEKRAELRGHLETERHRLRVRQAELQRKAAELVRAARERRRSIEQQVAAQQAELDERELEIKARRAALQDASRAELQQTSTELEQVLTVRLGEIEAEVTRRQAELDLRMEELIAVGRQASSALRKESESLCGTPLELSLDELDAMSRAGAGAFTMEQNRLENIQQEVAALRQAVDRIDGEAPAGDVAAGTRQRSTKRDQRWSGSLRARLNEKIASLRADTGNLSRGDDKPATLPADQEV
jgi:pSer/pThr/pTyr-binding forkhead associated (FHA) protein